MEIFSVNECTFIPIICLDIEGIKFLRSIDDEDAQKYMTAMIERSIKDPFDELSYLVKRNDIPIGYIAATDIGDYNVIIDIAIHIYYRRKGYATEITKIFCEHLKKEVNEIYAHVDKENEISQRLMKKVGFKKTQTEKGYPLILYRRR